MLNETETILMKTVRGAFEDLTKRGENVSRGQTEVLNAERTLRRAKDGLAEDRKKYEQEYLVLVDLLYVSGLADRIKNGDIGLGFLRGFPDFNEVPYSNSLIARLEHDLRNAYDRTDASSEGSTESTE